MDRTDARILMDQLGLLRQRERDVKADIEDTCNKLKGYMSDREIDKLKGLSFEGQLVPSWQPVWHGEAIEAMARKYGIKMSKLRSKSHYIALRTQKLT